MNDRIATKPTVADVLREVEWGIPIYGNGGDVVCRMCPQCGGPDRPDHMGPEGHFETCTLVAAIAQSEAADAVIAAALPPATEADMLERVKAINRTAEPTVLAAQADTIAKLRELLAEALPIVAYVSTGRSYVDVELYPDSTARIVNYKIREALGEYTAAALEDADARA